MGIVYIARHGETDWNREGRYQGRLESTLTELGKQQAEALAGALALCGVSRVIASPLRRTIDTALPLTKRTGLPLEVDRRLIEIGHGDWEGRLRAGIEREDPERMRLWRTEPELAQFAGGENLAAVVERWQSLVADLSALSGQGSVALITHDAVVRVALLYLAGRAIGEFWQPRVVNGGYARCLIRSDGNEVLEGCCDEHLGGLTSDPTLQAL
jgi:broad specificity phosphatase PhoE